MQPVSVWEKVWVASDAAGAGTSLKVMKWVRTDKKPVRDFLSVARALLPCALAIQRRRG